MVREAEQPPHLRPWKQADSFFEFKKSIEVLKIITEDIKLDAEVNRQLIDQDYRKKEQGKKTRRFPISGLFRRWTSCLETVDNCFKILKIEFYKD